MADRKTNGVVVAGLAGGLILVAAFTNSWLTAGLEGMELNVGLRNAELCVGGACSDVPIAEAFHGKLKAYKTAALITFGLCLLAGISLLLAAGLAASDRFRLGPIAPSSAGLVFSGLALMTAFYALLKFYGDTKGAMGLGYSFYLFGAGVIAAVVGCLQLGKAAVEGADDQWWD